jgi:Pyruvate/2-oxoacid:ferredoxin oxidoreductase delta subunit
MSTPPRDGYASVELHYLSGTGNTFRVAEWFAETARARGAVASLSPIPAPDVNGVSDSGDLAGSRLIGILSPTHGFTAPWGAVVHAATTPGVRGTDVFVLVTRAGWFVGPFLLPGFEGTNAWLLALVLALRGGRVRGVAAIDMPSNWTALHWGMTDAHAAAIVARGESKAATFAGYVLEGRRRLTGRFVLLWGLLFVPASLGYLAFARPALGRLFFADERCTSCGLCAKHCPFHAITMAGAAPAKPYWTLRCESCMRCMNLCPEQAIQVSWVGAAALTWMLVAVSGVTAALSVRLGVPLPDLASAVAACLAMLAVTVPAYALAWAVGRTRAFAWLLGHLTPTRLYRRYHEPGTDLRKL